jgi:hypothetical protein
MGCISFKSLSDFVPNNLETLLVKKSNIIK